MAKKQGSNIFTDHIEKVALAMGLVIFGWVVFTQFVRPPGVELSDGLYSASEAANKGLSMAESIKDRMKVPSDQPVKRYAAQVEKFGVTQSFELGKPLLLDWSNELNQVVVLSRRQLLDTLVCRMQMHLSVGVDTGPVRIDGLIAHPDLEVLGNVFEWILAGQLVNRRNCYS